MPCPHIVTLSKRLEKNFKEAFEAITVVSKVSTKQNTASLTTHPEFRTILARQRLYFVHRHLERNQN